jgi:hypothetical protein
MVNFGLTASGLPCLRDAQPVSKKGTVLKWTYYHRSRQINPDPYLGGGSDFGVFPSPGATVHTISRNLTPGKSGLFRPARPRSTARSVTHNIVKPSNRKIL